jgi:flagellar basal-body rod protein FlgB
MLSGDLFRLADRHAYWLNVRQRTIAENVAHSSTPDYVSKLVSAFDAGSESLQVAFARTNASHIRPNNRADAGGMAYKVTDDPGGGSVQLENEMINALDVRRSYELNTSIVKAFNRMILTAAKG